jgi:hypothetical protein
MESFHIGHRIGNARRIAVWDCFSIINLHQLLPKVLTTFGRRVLPHLFDNRPGWMTISSANIFSWETICYGAFISHQHIHHKYTHILSHRAVFHTRTIWGQQLVMIFCATAFRVFSAYRRRKIISDVWIGNGNLSVLRKRGKKQVRVANNEWHFLPLKCAYNWTYATFYCGLFSSESAFQMDLKLRAIRAHSLGTSLVVIRTHFE